MQEKLEKKGIAKKDKIGTRMLRKCNYAQRALCSFTLLPALVRVEFEQIKSSVKRTFNIPKSISKRSILKFY